LQSKGRRRIFLKLEGTAHFKLRQAIGKKNERRSRRASK
jgi:hypothetical protein